MVYMQIFLTKCLTKVFGAWEAEYHFTVEDAYNTQNIKMKMCAVLTKTWTWLSAFTSALHPTELLHIGLKGWSIIWKMHPTHSLGYWWFGKNRMKCLLRCTSRGQTKSSASGDPSASRKWQMPCKHLECLQYARGYKVPSGMSLQGTNCNKFSNTMLINWKNPQKTSKFLMTNLNAI